MDRIPEPELMNDLEQAKAYSEADFEEAHNRYVELLTSILGKNLNGKMLDLGCGSR